MVQVEVAEGWLEGEKLEVVTGDAYYYSFKGIPYAEPPLGKLRFKDPLPLKPWQGIRKATKHGPNCPQIDIFTRENIQGSEDCLYLNVYTPDLKPVTPLPVMFFIHGGGYKSGSGDDQHYGADFLVQHNVVIVTINYRLGIFGFLCLDTEEVPGNAGLKDQALALKWVNENISKFGGDPKNITVFGESAGGASTIYHILSPLSKGLFQRAISMSGVPICDWSLPYQPRRRAFTLGKILGLETEDSVKLLEFLQSIPCEKLTLQKPNIMAYEEVIHNNQIKFYHFTPVVERNFGGSHFLTENPLDVLRKGNINDVDIFIGHTNEESLVAVQWFEDSYIKDYNKFPEILAPREIALKANYDNVLEASDAIRRYFFGTKKVSVENMREFLTYASEVCLVYSIVRFADKIPKKQNKRYFYRFSTYSKMNHYGKNGEKHGIKGASHLDDLLYLFNANVFNMNVDKNSKEYELIQLACTVFTNFAKYGNPTPDNSLGIAWPEYDNAKRAIGDITDRLTVVEDYSKETQEFWKSVFENAGLEY
ncbi:hypothetical protein K1T71_001489 [Dendrolimus kikuchii]|uniref:Uncharacterized protein n=1 Tax=Dendrolimus kikuchii TaxID=765133 RepID=A0ACC1DHS4_9NEOP|nr:hypothetical protein K1T71_001489 [Dendrolimus kikuchii]